MLRLPVWNWFSTAKARRWEIIWKRNARIGPLFKLSLRSPAILPILSDGRLLRPRFAP
jgi:hypothetical protein